MKSDRRTKAGVRTTALWLTAIAVAIYAGFILLSVIRA
jgi:hypothetical protein